MANKMLIDASHPEETRVVVLRGNRVEEFDFESASKKQLRGNIYLAKVTRVEPSLQAAFVEYGGNRHGFLAFSEIHPDYYQIPHSDRAALLEEESRAHREEEDEDSSRRRSRRHRRGSERRNRNDDERVTGEVLADENNSELGQESGQNSGEGVSEPTDLATMDFAAPDSASASTEFSSTDSAPSETPSSAEGAHEGAPIQETFEAAHSRAEHAESEALDAVHATVETPSVVEAAPSPVPEPAPEAPHAADAEAPAAHADSHELACDPEGFAIVEESAAEQDRHDAAREDRHADGADDGEHSEQGETRARRSSEPDGEHADKDQDKDQDKDLDKDLDKDEEEEIVEQLGGDAMDETPYRMPRMRRQYKIQEVIKRRQVLLIQVVKEERGNKGAALTTYLSLAGRYSVLMPNTARGGGISRKITDASDRKRLKEIAGELEVPDGMGVILRTAGAARTKPEVKRDFEYLMRMWEQVRELTLTSSAPALVYEEGSLIKRAIRDLYNKDIDDVVVAGEAGFREARDFMRLLMPTHVKNVQFYREAQPIFAKWGAESQLDALFHTQVTLKSGGYLVINQTEALVAIDVNSGRSTREHNIEDTALRTNLEAADEVARQLRLRDLAGLIVVDFIDMEESRNNRSVERRIKEALKDDRARIQVGRISHFGLLEMSRQRIRTGVLEGSSILCPHCAGAGTVRSTASVAVHVMRVLEDALIKSATHDVILRTRTDIALYILNQKRSLLRLIEERFGVAVTVEADDSLTGGAYHALERGELAAGPVSDPLRRFDPRRPIEDEVEDIESEVEFEPESEPENVNEAESDAEVEAGTGDDASEERGEGDNDNRRRRRRRRGRGRGFEREAGVIDPNAPQPSDEGLETMAEIGGDLNTPVESGEDINGSDAPREDGESGRRGRGRWRRRGRGPRSNETSEFSGDWRPTGDAEGGLSVEAISAPSDSAEPAHAIDSQTATVETAQDAPAAQEVNFESPAPRETPALAQEVHAAPQEAAPEVAKPEAAAPQVAAPEPFAPAQPAPAPAPTQPELPVITAADPDKPKRSGWWARAKAGLTGN